MRARTANNRKQLLLLSAGVACMMGSQCVRADEGGVSFWLPGQFSSFAAVPGSPGWSLPMVYYHMDADVGASKNFPIGGNVVAGIDAGADLLLVVPAYTLANPVWGGQLVLSMAGIYGDVEIAADATLTGPGGNAITLAPRDSITGIGDLYPMATLKWNKGTSNYMAYVMGGVPVGEYDAGQLANVGTNHWSIDAGGGYTYLDTTSGLEYSSAIGVTYNFENSDTNYRNGVSSHLDLAVAQFLSPTWFVGVVGYGYYQLTGDSGSGARLGDFKSRVFAIGPQVGMFLGERKVYLNFKGYYEFDARNRPEGWNAWITLMIPFGPAAKH